MHREIPQSALADTRFAADNQRTMEEKPVVDSSIRKADHCSSRDRFRLYLPTPGQNILQWNGRCDEQRGGRGSFFVSFYALFSWFNRPACPHVGGNGDIHFCRSGRFSPIHRLDEGFFVDRKVQAFVELLLLPDRGRHSALVIVPGIDDRVVRQGEQFLANRVEQFLCGAALQIGSPIAADEQRIAGEDGARQHIACATIRMTWCSDCRQDRVAEPQRLTLKQKLIHAGDRAFGFASIHDLRAGPLLNERSSYDVVGMDVGFNGEAEGQSQFFAKSEVAFDIFDDGIDDDRLAERRSDTM